MVASSSRASRKSPLLIFRRWDEILRLYPKSDHGGLKTYSFFKKQKEKFTLILRDFSVKTKPCLQPRTWHKALQGAAVKAERCRETTANFHPLWFLLIL